MFVNWRFRSVVQYIYEYVGLMLKTFYIVSILFRMHINMERGLTLCLVAIYKEAILKHILKRIYFTVTLQTAHLNLRF